MSADTIPTNCGHRCKVRLVGSCGALWQCGDCPALFEYAGSRDYRLVDQAREAELREKVGPCV